MATLKRPRSVPRKGPIEWGHIIVWPHPDQAPDTMTEDPLTRRRIRSAANARDFQISPLQVCAREYRVNYRPRPGAGIRALARALMRRAGAWPGAIGSHMRMWPPCTRPLVSITTRVALVRR